MPESWKSFWISSGGGSAVIVPIVAFTLIGLAIASYPQFSWTDNALSDLGVVPGVTATLFNFGLILSGLLSLHLAIGLYYFLDKNPAGKVGAVLFAAASLSLEGIGWATENVRPFNFPLHYVFSVAFFSIMPISLLVIAGYFLIARQKPFAWFTLFIAIFAAAEWVLYFLVQYAPGVAIPELLSAIAGAAWAATLGWKMFRATSRPKKSPIQSEVS